VGRHRRVDPAREPDHRARGQAQLAEVVADAHDQAGLELGHGIRILHRFRCHGRRGFQVHHLEGRLEEGKRREDASPRIRDERAPVEDQLVVAAYLIHEDDGDTVARCEFGDHAPARGRPAHVPRRRGDVEDDAGTRTRQLADGIHRVAQLVHPGVLAHGEADRRAPVSEPDRLAALRPPEVTLLVEDVVGRKQRLRALGYDCSARQQHRPVVQLSGTFLLVREHGAERDRYAFGGRQQGVELA
jgi:hypothetical protein